MLRTVAGQFLRRQNGGGLMEREIANVAAASGMRGFPYMAFPPIIFDQPLIATAAIAAEAPEHDPQPPSVPVVEAPPAAVAPAFTPAAMAPPLADLLPAEPAITPAQRFEASPGRQAASAPQPMRAPERRFALLSDVSAEIRRLSE